jgi:hypothetical protein
MNHKPVIKSQSVAQIAPTDLKPIVEHGESPTSIILAIAILLSILFGGLTWLVYVILGGKPPR